MAVQKEVAQVEVQINGEKGGKTLKELKNDTKALRTEIDNLVPGSEEYNKKLAELQGKQKVLDDHQKAVKGIKDETKSLKDELAKAIPGYGQFTKFTEWLNGTAKATISNVQAMNLFSKALLATGITLFVFAIASLIAYFKSTDEGAKKLDAVFRAIGAITDVLVNQLVKFGEELFNAVSNPKQALNDFIDFLKGQVMNRINGFIEMWKAVFNLDFEKAADSALQVATGVENVREKLAAAGKFAEELAKKAADAAAAATELAEVFDELEERERRIKVQSKETENQINQLILQSKNRGKTEAERFALLDQAAALTRRNFEEESKFIHDTTEAVKKEVRQKTKMNKEEFDEYLNLLQNRNLLDADQVKRLEQLDKKRAQLRDDHLNRITEAQLKELDLVGQKTAVEEKIANRQATLQQEIDADRDKAMKEREAKQKAALDIENNILNLRIGLIEDSYTRELALLNKSYEDKLAAVKGNEEQIAQQKALLAEQHLQQLADLEAKYRQQNQDKVLAEMDEDNRALVDQLQLAASQRIIDEQTLQDKLYNIQKNALKLKLDLLKQDATANKKQIADTQSVLTKLEIDQNNKKFDSAKSTADKQNQLDRQRVQSVAGAVGGIGDLMVQLGGEQVKQQEAYKAVASAEVIVNGVAEVQGIWKANAIFPEPFHSIIAGVQTGLAVGRTLFALDKINSVKPAAKSARDGAIIYGAKHGLRYGEGGIALIDRITGQEVGEMEGEEPILTAGVTRNPTLLAAASKINVLGGGKPLFADGGISPGASAAIASASAATFDMGELVKLLQQMSDKLDGVKGAIEMKELTISIQEIQKKLETLKQIQSSTKLQ